MIAQKIWEQLDASVDQVMLHRNTPGEALWLAQGAARALSETLVIFMKPYFASSDEVAQEAMRRHRARASGGKHETPGLKHAFYQTLADGDAWYPSNGGWVSDPRQATGEPRFTENFQRRRAGLEGDPDAQAKPVPKALDLSSATVQSILMGAQVLSPAELAAAYSLSEAEVVEILARP